MKKFILAAIISASLPVMATAQQANGPSGSVPGLTTGIGTAGPLTILVVTAIGYFATKNDDDSTAVPDTTN